MTDLVNVLPTMSVTDGRMLYSLPRSHLMYMVDHFANDRRFSCYKVIILMCFQHFACLLAKYYTALKIKHAINGFPVSPGSAETMSKSGWKIRKSSDFLLSQ